MSQPGGLGGGDEEFMKGLAMQSKQMDMNPRLKKHMQM